MLSILILGTPTPAHAYVGPGAGFVFVATFFTLFVSSVLTVFSLLIWPFRLAWRAIRNIGRARPRVRRLIIVGFDGQDPKLTDRFIAEGKLPNFEQLARDGCYHPLATTYPSVSPVAWSSFSTGTHPAKHNVFDFLDRDRRTYQPVLSSVHMGGVDRVLKLGRFRVPLSRPSIRLLRRSKPFWRILGEHGFWSTVLRVPITFPPEKFRGALLAAMCVPDLLGTQGTFSLLTTRSEDAAFEEGGQRIRLTPTGEGTGDGTGESEFYSAALPGPPNELIEGAPRLSIPIMIEPDRDQGVAHVRLGGRDLELRRGELSDWVEVAFRAAPGIRVRGICRLMITEMDEHISLYVTPINIDPERPAMPVSHPAYYAVLLAKKLGKFATLGLAEDTWALNEKVIDDATFLQQTYDIDRERQDQFFAALDRLRTGSLVCVFDATDRIQHMFWRYIEAGHPAAGNGGHPTHRTAIEELYRHNDAMVGRLRERLLPDDVLIVLSDHGFTSFRRGVNLNAWLHETGYLVLKEGGDETAEWLHDVDWSKTRAYSLGLTGLFLNVAGRESHGIVPPADVPVLKAEIVGRLTGLMDEEEGEVAIREAFDTASLYSGPYLGNAPDILMGYNRGYRVSWEGAKGVVAGSVFKDNTKAWSGDHCVDPRLVPGVLFCNREISVSDPALIDIAPSALWLFGIDPPAHMDGQSLFADEGSAA